MSANNDIKVWGAREHNLNNIDVSIPHHSLCVITGVSGSGKSSLAFDTLFAEGQRRYIDTFSAYARNFLINIQRPDVEKIEGLSPVISIQQKTIHNNPRSTVGTLTEVYDFMRLLFARVATPYSYLTGEKMVKYTPEKLLDMIATHYLDRRIYILAPLVRQRKGHYRELFESLRKKGFIHVRIDGEMQELQRGMKTDRYRNHNIEVVVDKLKVKGDADERLKSSIDLAMRMADGTLAVYDADADTLKTYSRHLMCPTTGIAYNDPAPNLFSFNSPEGACPRCKGLGTIQLIDTDRVIPDRHLSVEQGAIAPLGKAKNQMIFWQLEAILRQYDATLRTPVDQLPDDAINDMLYGTVADIRIGKELMHTTYDYFARFDGVVKYLSRMMDTDDSAKAQKWSEQFLSSCTCPECHGQRLKPEARSYKIDNMSIADLCNMDISELSAWFAQLSSFLPSNLREVGTQIGNEIQKRLTFMLDVGLDYLSLNRPTASLSGGESQRIRLATQIGSQLVNVLYILDEPSIGLHQRDNLRLIHSLQQLRDRGNTVVVVEHDREMMEHADHIIDIGPRAGRAGGNVVYEGTYADMLRRDTLTARYLNGQCDTYEHTEHHPGNGQWLTLHGATGNNLKGIDVAFPLGQLIVVTGVSGSGKSTLINETLQPILSRHFYHSLKEPLPYKGIEGMEHIDKVISISQAPIGRTPRSNAATYTNVFSDIRSLFVNLPEAKLRGYKPGRFSFNVKGGRCEACGGNGYKSIEMNFLPDVYVPCEVCGGMRYNRETLEVRYRGKSIGEVLNMTVNQAVEFFDNVPSILHKLTTLQDVGLGYLTLGQSSTTLSGGESQRVKLATELEKRDTGRTFYILDEPTTGLHFDDIRILMGVLHRLVDKGNTVLIIEHNMDVIRQADYIIDMGPEGGRLGGTVVAQGTPEQVVAAGKGYTAPYLKKEMEAMQTATKKKKN
ncbi:MAG: excinuclease ABC subunit UvrA [Bacteroidaceae bacterium]|nr:excinuclease ABC subunit UvrA [Bacteroidaceae bacterium]